MEDSHDEALDNLLAFLFVGSGLSFSADGPDAVPRLAVPPYVSSAARVAANLSCGESLLPFGIDSDGLHLTLHALAPASETFDLPLYREIGEGFTYLPLEGDNGKAVVVLDRYDGWYDQLGRLGAALPQRSDGRSWRVDVVVKPVGWLGTYRRSRLTGRWFSGPHSIHEWGSVRT